MTDTVMWETLKTQSQILGAKYLIKFMNEESGLDTTKNDEDIITIQNLLKNSIKVYSAMNKEKL